MPKLHANPKTLQYMRIDAKYTNPRDFIDNCSLGTLMNE